MTTGRINQVADGLQIEEVESYSVSSRLPASRAERRGGERTPHPYYSTPNTCIHLSASSLPTFPPFRLEHPPQSSRVPIPFTHTLILASVHNTPAGGRDGAFQEKERKGGWQDHPLCPSLSRTAPSTFTAHPKPCRAGGEEGREEAYPLSLSSPPCLAFVFLVPSHRSKRSLDSKQQDSAPSPFS